jgi:hypothetical protein
MKHRASHTFWRLYDALPESVREQADRSFALLKENPRHPSLHFKKIEGTSDRWSVRVGSQYRALAREAGDEMRWHWIGTHNDYNRMLT